LWKVTAFASQKSVLQYYVINRIIAYSIKAIHSLIGRDVLRHMPDNHIEGSSSERYSWVVYAM